MTSTTDDDDPSSLQTKKKKTTKSDDAAKKKTNSAKKSKRNNKTTNRRSNGKKDNTGSRVTVNSNSSDDGGNSTSSSSEGMKKEKKSKRNSRMSRVNMDGSVSYLQDQESNSQQQQRQQPQTDRVNDQGTTPPSTEKNQRASNLDKARAKIRQKVQKRRDKYKRGPPQRTFSKEFLDLASKQQIESLYGSLKPSSSYSHPNLGDEGLKKSGLDSSLPGDSQGSTKSSSLVDMAGELLSNSLRDPNDEDQEMLPRETVSSEEKQLTSSSLQYFQQEDKQGGCLNQETQPAMSSSQENGMVSDSNEEATKIKGKALSSKNEQSIDSANTEERNRGSSSADLSLSSNGSEKNEASENIDVISDTMSIDESANIETNVGFSDTKEITTPAAIHVASSATISNNEPAEIETNGTFSDIKEDITTLATRRTDDSVDVVVNFRQGSRKKSEKPKKRKSIDADEVRSDEFNVSGVPVKKGGVVDVYVEDPDRTVRWMSSIASDAHLQPRHTPSQKPKKKPPGIILNNKNFPSSTTSTQNTETSGSAKQHFMFGIPKPPLDEEMAPNSSKESFGEPTTIPIEPKSYRSDEEYVMSRPPGNLREKDSRTLRPEQYSKEKGSIPVDEAFLVGRKTRCRLSLFMLVLVIAVSAIIIFVLVRLDVIGQEKEQSNNDTNAMVPTMSPTQGQFLSQQPTSSTFSLVAEAVLEKFGEDTLARLIDDMNSPQARAAKWIGDVDEVLSFPLDDDEETSIRFCQRYGLAVFYYSTGGSDSWRYEFNFLSESRHECTWNEGNGGGGVMCADGDGLVTDILMPSNNLVGSIPPEIVGLTDLKSLVLDDNPLSGSISRSIAQLSRLESLSIDKSKMTGTIPTDIGNLSLLRNLVLAKSSFSGNIPNSIRSLISLTTLDLRDNFLDSTIPDRITDLPLLAKLDLSLNKLAGKLPTSGSFGSLNYFAVDSNRLTGTIESSLLVPNLRILSLRNNRLSGRLPTNWLASPSLATIDVSENSALTGSIPPVIGSLFELKFLYATDCSLTGSLPAGLGNALLEEVDLEGNYLSGSVPESFIQLPLAYFGIGRNTITGSVDFLCDIPSSPFLSADCPTEVQCSCCSRCYNEDEEEIVNMDFDNG